MLEREREREKQRDMRRSRDIFVLWQRARIIRKRHGTSLEWKVDVVMELTVSIGLLERSHMKPV